jgi:ATP-dependent helicase/nuclease subunit B
VLVKFLLGPAGSGKTFRCLSEIRDALRAHAEGAPLLFLAPKQSTYQLERALLTDAQLSGYTRLQVLSFERLAEYVFETLGISKPGSLSSEGRLMVLRGIIAKRRNDLKLYRASTRLTGFADQLAVSLEEFQRQRISAEQVLSAAGTVTNEGLSLKLHDLGVLLQEYTEWLETHELLDDNAVLAAACEALRKAEPGQKLAHALWVDGFADLSRQEATFVAALARHCDRTTMTFCLEGPPAGTAGDWLSSWRTVEKSFLKCQKAVQEWTGGPPEIEQLHCSDEAGRFAQSPLLRHLERHWSDAREFFSGTSVGEHLRIVSCPDPRAEVREAAREILRYVRSGGRFRDVTVLVRQLPSYDPLFRRIFDDYEIPSFIDSREGVSHHPLAELTRSAIRSVVFNWDPEDWFTALKSGLLPVPDEDIDRLENESLARGWRGEVWLSPVSLPSDSDTEAWLQNLLRKIMPPFERLRSTLLTENATLNGKEVAAAIQQLWEDLDVAGKIDTWAALPGVGPISGETHRTVLSEMETWLENVALGFATDRLTCREWIPILEAGLSRLTVGLIPPALDQVLIGSIDRSRNAEAKLVLVLGLNETVFPASPQGSVLLTESDRAALQDLDLADSARDQMARERHFAYLAFTRATRRLVLSWCSHDSAGKTLNPSPILSQVYQLFPALEPEVPSLENADAEHPNELIVPILQRFQAPGNQSQTEPGRSWTFTYQDFPSIARVLATVQSFGGEMPAAIPEQLAHKLYGSTLRTSVSRLEQFAACPFRFFVHSALDARERVMFEVDAREKGSFQHEVLAEFHERLARKNKRWRDLTPQQARDLVQTIAGELAGSYRDGLLLQDEATRFSTKLMTEALQEFIETLVEWMRTQYCFDPAVAEMGFGQDSSSPGWELDLGGGLRLHLQGRIDRVDVHRGADGNASCVVIDYKSSHKKLDPVLVDHGIQLQLLSYLSVARHLPGVKKLLGVNTLTPAGVFYVSLRGSYPGEKNRAEALENAATERREAYRHEGRFDLRFLRLLDSREKQTAGDQIPYHLKNDGQLYSRCVEAMPTSDFEALLDLVESNLRDMGRRIFKGEVAAAPYRKGSEIACNRCDYSSVCRSDPWTQDYRVLSRKGKTTADSLQNNPSNP